MCNKMCQYNAPWYPGQTRLRFLHCRLTIVELGPRAEASIRREHDSELPWRKNNEDITPGRHVSWSWACSTVMHSTVMHSTKHSTVLHWRYVVGYLMNYSGSENVVYHFYLFVFFIRQQSRWARSVSILMNPNTFVAEYLHKNLAGS